VWVMLQHHIFVSKQAGGRNDMSLCSHRLAGSGGCTGCRQGRCSGGSRRGHSTQRAACGTGRVSTKQPQLANQQPGIQVERHHKTMLSTADGSCYPAPQPAWDRCCAIKNSLGCIPGRVHCWGHCNQCRWVAEEGCSQEEQQETGKWSTASGQWQQPLQVHTCLHLDAPATDQ
jgi:hypothetical protein